ncbi:fumarylacetoacetate hydrolase family protein [Sphingobacterium sp. DR205]|uniref:fumarylacetoacetate hydrolase family protein n=1 Tax=Sphingobacterium sp. DR205 TaxID=2713573 RepID=UPI0013E4CC1B|nr:fumarylacetoacetate hydrolase family protein [Sphingobacterium sp. DR205]QIH33582.1 fumarylacetoacetate hydrolase family protein [Sphingobacterium sp. DR205]
MKIFRYGAKGSEKAGVILNEKKYDVSEGNFQYNRDFFANTANLEKLQAYVEKNSETLKEIDVNERIGTPLETPSKILCVGLNFDDHVKETNLQQAAEPIVFMKSVSAFNGPFDGITLPKNSVKSDWETELAIVIGKKASYVSEEEALDYVFGYVLHNDVTEREFQIERGGTWDKGKGCDTFAPIGPFIATKDEIQDVDNMRIWLKLNGELMQDGNTSDFIYRVPKLISYLSQFMSLLPGDIISTGSPAGSGMGKSPQRFLRDGDIIEYGIEGLGFGKQVVSAYSLS